MPHINRSMTRYLQRELGVSEAEATALRQAYWHRYGATLVGMMRLHGTSAAHFLRETHELPELAGLLVAEGGLRHALKRIPGPKLILSNAPLHYAERVLRLLRVQDFFEAIYCIERTRFRPKPAPEGFRRVLKLEGLVPSRCVLVDDTLDNLRAAKRLRMKTVWVSRESRAPACVDVRLASVTLLPRAIHVFASIR
jgi:putative hydrolase of the HAD superfamily